MAKDYPKVITAFSTSKKPDPIIHEGIAGITLTYAPSDPRNATRGMTLIEYGSESKAIFTAMIKELLKAFYEDKMMHGVAENAIYGFWEDEGMLVDKNLAHMRYKRSEHEKDAD